jgi:hypothetical protein
MKKIWDKRGCHWYSKKELGKLYWNKKHPDYLRDRLNEKGMRKLKKVKSQSDIELYLRVASRMWILSRVILLPWRWKLSLISPSSKGGTKEVLRWQLIAEERYGKVRRMILQSNLQRNKDLKRI